MLVGERDVPEAVEVGARMDGLIRLDLALRASAEQLLIPAERAQVHALTLPWGTDADPRGANRGIFAGLYGFAVVTRSPPRRVSSGQTG